MADREQSNISVAFVALEAQAAAHFISAMSCHLLALAAQLPRPPEHIQDLVYEAGSEEAFEPYPGFALASCIEVIANTNLDAAIKDLNRAAAQHEGTP